MKEYNCPDCERTDSCAGCQRTNKSTVTTYPTEFGVEYFTSFQSLKSIPLACKNCPNHISNGGSGICHCILGMQNIY